MHHYRKTRKSYKAHNAVDKVAKGCTFCKEVGQPRVIRENDTMFVIKNRVAYDMFEDLRVLEHLMVIPKRHVDSLFKFTDKEKIDQMNIAGEYEARGYNVYARGVRQLNRSVEHQHTHLIKLDNKKPKFVFYAPKPHILINK